MNQVTLNPVTLMYHEVRAPLGLLATAARAAAEECGDDHLVRRRCETILLAAERVLRISQQVLALAGATDDQRDEEQFAPAQLVQALASNLADLGLPVTASHGLQAFEARANVPPAQFEAVLHSLLMNAVDHSPPGTEISITTSVERDRFCVRITNTVDRTYRHRGLGVGLYLCEQLVRGFGGELNAGMLDGQYEVELLMPETRAQAVIV